MAEGKSIPDPLGKRHDLGSRLSIQRPGHGGKMLLRRRLLALDRRAAASFSFAPDTNDRLLELRITPSADTQSPRASAIRPLTIAAALNLYGRPADMEAQP